MRRPENPRPMSSRHWLIGLFALSLIIIAVLALGLKALSNFLDNGHTFPAPNGREWVDSRGGLNALLRNSIPDDAVDIEYSGSGFLQAAIAKGRFRIPSNSLDNFLSTLGFEEPLLSDHCPFKTFCANDADWWKPEDAQVYAGGQVYSGLAASGTEYNIMVDMTNPQIYTVYVLMFLD